MTSIGQSQINPRISTGRGRATTEGIPLGFQRAGVWTETYIHTQTLRENANL